MFAVRSLVHTRFAPKISRPLQLRGFSQDKKGGSKWGLGGGKATNPPSGKPQEAPQQAQKAASESGQSSAYTRPSSGGKGGLEMPKLFSKTEESKFAWALLDVANRNGAVDEVARDAYAITQSVQGGPLAALGRIFTDRALTTKDRMRKIEPIMKNFNPYTQRAVRMLINQMNGVLVPTVMETYLNLLREAKKEFTAVVTTPKALTAEERQKYIQIAKEKLNKGNDVHITLVEKIDERFESGYTLSLPNLYVNKSRVKDEGKKEKKKQAILSGINTTAAKELEGPKVTYEQWLLKQREQFTEELIKQLSID